MTHLRAFLAEEQKRRPAASRQARTAAALERFFRFLVEEERIVRDPALPLRTPTKRETLPDTLSMGELERLRQIQELLGHKHLDSTQRYTRVNAHELRGAVKRLRWVGELQSCVTNIG